MNSSIHEKCTRHSQARSRLMWFASLYAGSLVTLVSVGASMRLALTYL